MKQSPGLTLGVALNPKIPTTRFKEIVIDANATVVPQWIV